MKEEKERLSWFRRNLDGLGVISSLSEEVKDMTLRVIYPPSEKIVNMAKETLNKALESLNENVSFEEYIKILHTIEDIYREEEGVNIVEGEEEPSKEKILRNVHFWLQILRDKKLGKLGTRLKYIDPSKIQIEPKFNETAAWIIENRIENIQELEEKFLKWVEKYNVRELLENGSFQLITNHDQWSTQAISLYFFQKHLGVSVDQSATVVGLRVLTFKKFKFDPEEITRGHGHILVTAPPTKNGRHESFDDKTTKRMGSGYIKQLLSFLSTTGNIVSTAPGGTRDKYNEEGIVPVMPVTKALELLQLLQKKTIIIPIAFNHGEGFHLEKMREKVHVDVNFGKPIEKGGELTGEEIWQQLHDIVPNQKEVEITF